MVIIIVSPKIEKIVNALKEYDEYMLIRKKGPRAFIYVNTTETNPAVVVRNAKKLIVHLITAIYIFEVYTLYNGMIDLFGYLPKEKKDVNKYYIQSRKDLSDDELAKWKAQNL